MKIKKMLILTILLCALLCLLSTNVFAYNPIGGKFSRGVSNTCYYVSPSVSAYTSRINAAANNWVNTGHGWNPIYMTAVSSSYLTHMDFYGEVTSYWGDSNVRGETRMFTNSGQDITNVAKTTNWMYAEIRINTSVVATNTIQTQGTFGHEMGHAFGLNHVSDRNCLMYGVSNERLTHVVSADDHNGINALYN